MNEEQCQAFKAIPGIKSVWIVYDAKGVDSVWTTQEKANWWIEYLANHYSDTGNTYKIVIKEVDNAMS